MTTPHSLLLLADHWEKHAVWCNQTEWQEGPGNPMAAMHYAGQASAYRDCAAQLRALAKAEGAPLPPSLADLQTRLKATEAQARDIATAYLRAAVRLQDQEQP